MLKKLLSFFAFIIIPLSALGAIDPSKLLKPMEAFSPQVVVQDNHTTVQFQIADGYYLYKSKTLIKTQPENLFGTPQYSQGKEKTDDFFGTQEIYLNAAQVILPHRQTLPEKWTISVEFQGCAAVACAIRLKLRHLPSTAKQAFLCLIMPLNPSGVRPIYFYRKHRPIRGASRPCLKSLAPAWVLIY